jgi:hypothetical protein
MPNKISAYSAFFFMSAIRLFLASSLPMFGALVIYLLFIGDFEMFLGFQMSLPSVAGVFTLSFIGTIVGIGAVMNLMKEHILREWDSLKDWYNG